MCDEPVDFREVKFKVRCGCAFHSSCLTEYALSNAGTGPCAEAADPGADPAVDAPPEFAVPITAGALCPVSRLMNSSSAARTTASRRCSVVH